MNGGFKVTSILLFILVLMLGGMLYLTSSNAKTNEETLLKSVQDMQKINEEMLDQQEKWKEDSVLLKRELEKLQKEVESLLDKNTKLEKEKEDLLKKLQAKKEQEKLMAMNKANSSSSSVNPPKQTESSSQKNKQSPPPQKPASNGKKVAYLTFDDGPSKNTERILNTLKQHNVKATFFVNGRTDGFSKSIYKRIVNEGHAIGNHTYTHNYSKIYSSKNGFMKDFNQLENYLQSLVGVSPRIVRFPGGSNNQVSWKYGGKGVTMDIAKELQSKGYVYFDWNVDSTDASVAKQSKQKIVSSVLNGSQSKNTANILMHDSGPKTTTADALPEIIQGLKNQGFTFEILTTNSYAPQFSRP